MWFFVACVLKKKKPVSGHVTGSVRATVVLGPRSQVLQGGVVDSWRQSDW